MLELMLEGSSFLGNAGEDGDAGTFSPPPALWQPAGYSSSGQGGASTGAAAATMRHTDRGSVQSPIEFNNTHSKANPLLFSQRSPSPSACTCSMCVSECNECCHDCAVELRTNASGAICTAVTLLAIIYACTVFIGGDTVSAMVVVVGGQLESITSTKSRRISARSGAAMTVLL